MVAHQGRSSNSVAESHELARSLAYDPVSPIAVRESLPGAEFQVGDGFSNINPNLQTGSMTGGVSQAHPW